MPPPIRHTSGTLCRPPTCAHEHTHNGPLCPSPCLPSLPFSLFLLPPSPSPPLLSSLGLEHWVPEPGLGKPAARPPWRHCWTHCMHTPCLPAPQPSLATAMGTRVSCGRQVLSPQGGGGKSHRDEAAGGKLRLRAKALAQGHSRRMRRPQAQPSGSQSLALSSCLVSWGEVSLEGGVLHSHPGRSCLVVPARLPNLVTSCPYLATLSDTLHSAHW